jgi:hypothetical protein
MLLRGLARDFDDPALGGGLLSCCITAIVLPLAMLPFWAAAWVFYGSNRTLNDADLAAVLFGALGCFGVFYVVGMCLWLSSLLGRLRRLLASPRPGVEPPPINGWG